MRLLWENIPWRCRLLRAWFREVTVLPGDVLWSPMRDVQLTVREVKPSRVVCEVVSGRYLCSLLDGSRSHLVACVEVFPRRPFGWWLR